MSHVVEPPVPGSADLEREVERRRRELADLEARLAAWEATAAAMPQRDDTDFTTVSGQPVRALFTPLDTRDDDYLRDVGLPGEYPFTRGPYATMYRTRLWTKRLFSGFATAEETNERYKFLLARGTTGLSVAFDFPTLMGYDSDDPLCEGEVGKCGVAISSLADMETLFDGIPLDRVSVSMTINGPAIMLYCFLLAAAEKQGVPFEKVTGTIQNDILKEYQAQHAWIYPPKPALKIITDIFEWSSSEAPKFNTISISGYHIREAGATAVEELAFTLKNGFTYVEEGIARGLDVDEFAPRLSFFWDVHNDFFEEIAKFRAGRRIWARHMREVYGAKRSESWRLRTHAQTAGVTLTAQRRSGGLPGTGGRSRRDSVATHQRDGRDAGATHRARGADCPAYPADPRVRDRHSQHHRPAGRLVFRGGHDFVEGMTDELERQAEEIFTEIDDLGGVVAGIESGYFQARIARSARRFQEEVEAGSRLIVGVNSFEEESESDIEILRIDESAGEAQHRRLAELRRTRDSEAVERSLAALTAAATADDNLMPPMLDAVRSYATLGEIRAALEVVYGRFKEPVAF
jgi:methylmalonyl-CoA mutase N-terminal domain/subunit